MLKIFHLCWWMRLAWNFLCNNILVGSECQDFPDLIKWVNDYFFFSYCETICLNPPNIFIKCFVEFTGKPSGSRNLFVVRFYISGNMSILTSVIFLCQILCTDFYGNCPFLFRFSNCLALGVPEYSFMIFFMCIWSMVMASFSFRLGLPSFLNHSGG